MAFEKLDGFYRGTVIQHVPSGNGMCKVFVYGVYPDEWMNMPDKIPPAEQASSLFAGANAGNGVFSYPNIGSTVWCFFANGDQNFPVYFAASLGGDSASMRWNEVKCNTSAKTIASGDDAYIHKIDANMSTIKIWESGYIEVQARTGSGQDTAKIVLDGKGNVIIDSTQQIQVKSPSVKIEAADRLTLSAPTVKISAGSMLAVDSPVYLNSNSTSHTVTAPSIDMNASAGMVAIKGKRHTNIVN